MPDTGVKNNIVLSDYNYQRDIENRCLMAEFSVFDVEVLREILDGSLKITINSLAENLNASIKQVQSTLNKLAKVSLIKQAGETITVDKEMRKYYDSQILKFDESFEPNMEFLQGLLGKVPIHALPHWYSLPKSAMNIFSSIVDTYLINPKVYERYLKSLKFKEPVMHDIMESVFGAKEFKVPAKTFIKKHGLSREKFEEHMLLLEYNLVCCLSYSKINDKWEEVVTPFHEWKTYLKFIQDNYPQKIKDTASIKKVNNKESGYLLDISSLLKLVQRDQVKIKKVAQEYVLPKEVHNQLQRNGTATEIKDYLNQLVTLMIDLELLTIKGDNLTKGLHAREWLEKSLQDQGIYFYRYLIRSFKETLTHFGEKDIREIERNLTRVTQCDWIYFDDFLKGLTAQFRDLKPVTLINKGKRWQYAIPTYLQKDYDFVYDLFKECLFPAGIIELGLKQGKVCFSVTTLGKHFLH